MAALGRSALLPLAAAASCLALALDLLLLVHVDELVFHLLLAVKATTDRRNDAWRHFPQEARERTRVEAVDKGCIFFSSHSSTCIVDFVALLRYSGCG